MPLYPFSSLSLSLSLSLCVCVFFLLLHSQWRVAFQLRYFMAFVGAPVADAASSASRLRTSLKAAMSVLSLFETE